MRRIVFSGLILACLGTLQAQGPGKWVKLAPFPEPAVEVKGEAAGGKLYVFGGILPGQRLRGLVYEYDPAADKWTKKKPMPVATAHVAYAELNGKIYSFGGFVSPTSGAGGFVPVDNAWEYDPTADTWKALAPMPSRRGGAVAAVVGGKFYVISGASFHPGSAETVILHARPHRSVTNVEEYDPATNTWRVRSPIPTARVLASIGVVNGKIYVIGGRLGSIFMSVSSNTNIVEEYNPATDSWGAMRAHMPTPRSAAAWGTYGGKIYVAGGEDENDQLSIIFRSVEAYDPAANQWASLPSLPVGRFGLAGNVLGNRLHIVTGSVQAKTDIHAESPSHDAFQLTGR